MKFKIILLVGFIVIAAVFVLCTKRTTHYSNSGEKIISAHFFDFVCKRIQSADKIEKLEISFDFHALGQETLEQLSVIPMANHKDTLKLQSVYTNNTYVFVWPTTDKLDKLDLMINYKVDSAGVTINKSLKYYNLEKVYTYSFRTSWF